MHMEQHSIIFCECEFLTIFFWTLPKGEWNRHLANVLRLFWLRTNSLHIYILHEQNGWEWVSFVFFRSKCFIWIYLVCSITAWKASTLSLREKKKCLWKNSVEYFDKIFIFLSWFWRAFSTKLTQFCEPFSLQKYLFLKCNKICIFKNSFVWPFS